MNIYYEKGRMMMNMTEEYNRLIGKRVKCSAFPLRYLRQNWRKSWE